MEYLGCCASLVVTWRLRRRRWGALGALSTDAASELHVLWHDGDAFGVDGTQVGVFEETDEVGLRCLLEMGK